jgi:sucrose phosphorylase
VVRTQIDLIRFRNTHPAFGGQVHVEAPAKHRLEITWQSGVHTASLEVDVSAPNAWIACSGPNGTKSYAVTPECAGIAAWDARS